MVNIYKDAAGSSSLGVDLDAENSPQVSIALEIAMLFADVLNPVAPVAQQRVKKPDDLDLDSWINTPPKGNNFIFRCIYPNRGRYRQISLFL